MAEKLELKIDSWTPETIPQARLGTYLIEATRIYGEPDSVHFVKLRKGSTVIESRVDHTAIPKVVGRLLEIGAGGGPKDARDALGRVDDMLAEDNAVGLICGLGLRRPVRIAGRERPRQVAFEAVREPGIIEGELVRIGGVDRSIHLAVRRGAETIGNIETTLEMGRKLGALIRGPIVRLHGVGTWRRAGGRWTRERFVVSSFEEIDARPLEEQIAGVRDREASQWHLDRDPLATLASGRE